jgi:hypothetical protein
LIGLGAAVALALIAVVVPTSGDTELALVDGRVLRGTEVRRDNGSYVLTLENEIEIVLPAELVESVRLIGMDEPSEEWSPEDVHSSQPTELTGRPVPEGPTGLRSGGPQTLAGRTVTPPRTSEQLEVFGEPARFQEDIVDSRWKPESDWEMDPVKQNNFAPSSWSKGVIDPNWQPTSGFDAQNDVLKDSRSTWAKSVIDSSWEPTDGFKTSVGRR